jgi:hypothetical protein
MIPSSRVETVLTWALALSWTPLVAIIIVALVLRDLMPALFVALTLIVWLVKLGDIFGVLTRRTS